MNNVVPIFFACDDNFVKFTIVTMKSIMENASKDQNYKFYVLNTNISDKYINLTKQVVAQYENFSVEFEDVSFYLESISDRLPLRDYYSKTTYFRLFIAEMHEEMKKAIYIDSDTIVKGDIYKLYNHDLGNNIVGACHEQAMIQTDVYGEYVEKNLGLNRYEFFNAGMLVINCDLFREECVLDQFIDLLNIYDCKVTQDEDYLNIICKDRVFWINDSWNTEVYEEIKFSEEEINMIHYIMWAKPWHFTNVRLEHFFWQYAKQTPVYEEILEILNNYTDIQRAKDLEAGEHLAKLAIEETNNKNTYILASKKRKSVDRLKVLKRIKEYELRGEFDKDVEQDPPSRVIMPDEVDYLKKKLSSKIKTRFAYFIARRFLNKINRKKQMIVKDIIGTENLRNLNSGAVMTCNHFNAFDSFAVQMAYEASCDRKKRKFFRVIKEGNYTSFPGFYGFLMRNCYTLPLSSNARALAQFMRATNQLLQDGHIVLVYPEQSMWWNYRKPKPLKKGAYQFAVKSKTPVVPCFITMADSDILGADGFYIQEYTIHIGKPIYPKEDLSNSENLKYLMDENYKVWKDIYEKTYNIPLEYNTLK